MPDEMKHILIYTDGACDPNPGGPGGYGAILVYNGKKKELSGGFKSTTNNRMEIYAAIIAIEALKEPCRITLHSDSEYVVKAINEGWVQRWKANNWWRNKQEKAVNADLWERLLVLCETHNVEFVWVKGHSGHLENERCDYLSYEAIKKDNIPIDEGYSNRTEEDNDKIKIFKEGQPCRKCSTPVIKRIPKKPKKTQAYYFEYYFYCPNCGTMYMVEDAKRIIDASLAKSLEVIQEGQKCLKCSTPVIKRLSHKSNYYLYCPHCSATYEIKNDQSNNKELPTLFD